MPVFYLCIFYIYHQDIVYAQANSHSIPSASIENNKTGCQKDIVWGSALSLHREIPELSLGDQQNVARIKRQGFEAISLVVHWHQTDIYSHDLRPQGKEWIDDQRLLAMIRHARQAGFKILLFPIIWLNQRAHKEWRGVLKPRHKALWWNQYQKFILHYAQIAAREKVDWLSIGSELSSMESNLIEWQKLIRLVREVYPGDLIYSANWDHYQSVSFWHLLDVIGMTGYHEIARQNDRSLHAMKDRWHLIKAALFEWHSYHQFQIPIMFTEVGYASQQGSAVHPWNYTQSKVVDLEEQYLAYRSFIETWQNSNLLCAVFWNSWGLGGLQDSWYTLTGKPILSLIRSLLKSRKRTVQSH